MERNSLRSKRKKYLSIKKRSLFFYYFYFGGGERFAVVDYKMYEIER